MLHSKYLTKEDKDEINSRFIKVMKTLIGSEPYKRFKDINTFCQHVGISRQLYYNLTNGRNSVTLDFLAIMQNMLGEDFDARYIITGDRYISNNLYGMPDGYIAVPLEVVSEISAYSDILKIKANQILSRKMEQD